MMSQETLFLILLAGIAAIVTFVVARAASGEKQGDKKVRERLVKTGASDRVQGIDRASATAQFKSAFERIGQAAAKPFMPENREKQSELKHKLGMAGVYNPTAIRLVQGCKFILLGTGLFVGCGIGLLMDSLMMGFALGGLAGYLAPTIWLRLKIKRQQLALEYGLPDALDLMVVCVEAGLAVDAAMQRVGQELALAHPELSRELEIAHMETRVGLSRIETLRNLGARTGAPSLQSLASMLIQAERFGTSVASALKVHGDSLRTNRQFRAEEKAAKASVKLSIPLVLFIFPATFITLAGPTIVELMNSSIFK